jgi:hypothetical protein
VSAVDDSLRRRVRDALEGDSNDAEHDALVAVANALGISYGEDVCSYCHDRPVRNAAAWIMAHQPHYSPCPRCGHKIVPDDEREAESKRERQAQARP